MHWAVKVLAFALPRSDDRVAVDVVLVVEAREGVLALVLLNCGKRCASAGHTMFSK
jgi:hypothetical protein